MPLDPLIEQKVKELGDIDEKQKESLHRLLDRKQINHHRFKKALKVAGLSVIAEIDCKKDKLFEISDEKLVHQYSKAGAAAISLSSNNQSIEIGLKNLEVIINALASLHPCPVLYHDLVIDPLQIAQSKKKGASAVLLKVSVLKDRLGEMIEVAEKLGIDALVQVSSEEELSLAINAHAQIIDVFNFDVETSSANLEISKKLSLKIPKEVIKIASFGILNFDHAHQMHELGYDGIVISEAFEGRNDFRKMISEISNI